jgi:hypothetical protein
MTVILSLVSFGLAVSGFAGLSLSMPRHHREAFGKQPSPGAMLALRAAGYGAVALALWPCVETFGVAVGIVAWLGMLTAAALAVVGLLSWRPRAVRWASFAAVPILSWLLLRSGWQG